jgi:molybdate transport system regulatory protein
MSDSVSIKIRLHNQDAVALGPGKADLLDAIVQHGSISAAGRAMGMSYKRAWDLVNTMNLSFSKPLVTTVKGGSHGGGAEVTEFGQTILAAYRELEKKAYLSIVDDIDQQDRTMSKCRTHVNEEEK